jgi:hypothetical protein
MKVVLHLVVDMVAFSEADKLINIYLKKNSAAGLFGT